MEYNSAIKRIMLFEAIWMDLEIIMLSKGNQKEKEYCMISLICGT